MKTLPVILWSLGLISGAMAFSPAPQPKPPLEMLDAIQKATSFAKAHHDLSHHYLDRVWLDRVGNEEERKWIVSWSPDSADRPKGMGWVILTVDMGGNVSRPKDGVSWIDKRTIDALRKLEEVEQAIDRGQREVIPR